MTVFLFDVLHASAFLGALAIFFAGGTLLVRAWLTTKDSIDRLEDRVNSLLPQIQCAKCGYPGCLPYAEAVVQGERLDLCPPGGNATAQAMGELLDRPVVLPNESFSLDRVAAINEQDCVGCSLCIASCPVDAIVGAEQYTHTVLQKHCTGCELCVPVCPVDCIDLIDRALTT